MNTLEHELNAQLEYDSIESKNEILNRIKQNKYFIEKPRCLYCNDIILVEEPIYNTFSTERRMAKIIGKRWYLGIIKNQTFNSNDKQSMFTILTIKGDSDFTNHKLIKRIIY